MKFAALAVLFPLICVAVPTNNHGSHENGDHPRKQPAFFLAGDSTTAVQAANGGGWGNGFLSFLRPPSWGVNKGHNGATTVSFREDGDWDVVLQLIRNNTKKYDCYVTIQFGHNDQKPAKNITMAQFEANLIQFTKEVRRAGGTPLLLTSLTRRSFNSSGELIDNLADVVPVTREAAKKTGAVLLDLNAASRKYVQTIGQVAAQSYNLVEGDRTHLNDWGSVVFGRIVADLLLDKNRRLREYIKPNATLSALIAHGIPA